MVKSHKHYTEWKKTYSKEYMLYNMFIWSSRIGKINLWWKKSEQRFPLEVGVMFLRKDMRELSRLFRIFRTFIEVWYYTLMNICHNSLNGTFMIIHFMVCKFYLKKTHKYQMLLNIMYAQVFGQSVLLSLTYSEKRQTIRWQL